MKKIVISTAIRYRLTMTLSANKSSSSTSRNEVNRLLIVLSALYSMALISCKNSPIAIDPNEEINIHRFQVGYFQEQQETSIIRSIGEMVFDAGECYENATQFLTDNYHSNFFKNNFLVLLYFSENQKHLSQDLGFIFDEQEIIINLYSEKILDDSDLVIKFYLYVLELDKTVHKNRIFSLNKTHANLF